MSEATFTITDAPQDETPNTEAAPGAPFDPRYPDSTPEAPYGYKPDGTPYKRHHGGAGSRSSGRGNMPASNANAAAAAALLARVNNLVGVSLHMFGMVNTANALVEANEQFEVMAREALATDPVLCRKILSAGASSGKAGLTMAYIMLGAQMTPAALQEYKAKRAETIEGESEYV